MLKCGMWNWGGAAGDRDDWRRLLKKAKFSLMVVVPMMMKHIEPSYYYFLVGLPIKIILKITMWRKTLANII